MVKHETRTPRRKALGEHKRFDLDFGGVTCLPPQMGSWLVSSKVSSGLVVAVTSVES